MFYSLVGRIVWSTAKWYARRRLGRLRAPRPVLAGSVVALALAALLIGTRNHID
jgi:hypothetical protein